MNSPERIMEEEAVRGKVREGYGKIASCSGAPAASCCGGPAHAQDQLSAAIGYSADELAGLPCEANMGLSCGNPTAIASLQPGEVALDLGCGGGFDAFLAGPKVGASGRVIGVDMTPEMLARARRGLRAYHERTGLSNIDFRLGEIKHLPVADASVDVVISNCVLNLSPAKAQVWREIARVLKPGGRVAISDLALIRPMPPAVAEMVEALVGCVAGAALIEDVQAMIEAAGLERITLTPHPEYVAAMTEWNDPLYKEIARQLPAGTTAADFITSVSISAGKPK